MNKIPTVEEILDSYSTFDEFGNRIWMLNNVLNAMKESNKLHVKAALEAAADNAEIINIGSVNSNGENCDYYEVDKNSILNAYHENLII